MPPSHRANQRTGTPPARKLAFAVFGVSFAAPLRALHDTLQLKALAARALGYAEAADAFASASRRIGQVSGPPDGPIARNTQLRDPDYDAALEAAALDVHAAYALIPRGEGGALVPATARRPDPQRVADVASLVRELRILLGWTATSVYALAEYARRQRCEIARGGLRGILVDERLPLPAEVDVILSVCDVEPPERVAWYQALERAQRQRRTLNRPLDPHAAPPVGAEPHLLSRTGTSAAADEPPPTPCEPPAPLTPRAPPSSQPVQDLQPAPANVPLPRAEQTEQRRPVPRTPPPRTPTEPLPSAALTLRCLTSPLLDILLDREESPARDRATPSTRGRPSPYGMRTSAVFADRLAALVRWSGRTLVEITQEAERHGVVITTVPLRHTLVRRELPTATVLLAFTAGCQLSGEEREHWERARARLAAAPSGAHRLPATTPLRSAARMPDSGTTQATRRSPPG